MVPADPADIAGGLIPKLLQKQETLSNGVVGPERPVRVRKALIARRWLRARSGAASIGAEDTSRIVLIGEARGDQLGGELGS